MQHQHQQQANIGTFSQLLDLALHFSLSPFARLFYVCLLLCLDLVVVSAPHPIPLSTVVCAASGSVEINLFACVLHENK